jgi:Tfp pilus assembly protein PilE
MPHAGPLPPAKSNKTATVVVVVVVGLIGFVAIAGIAAAIVIPSLLAARKAANESSAIGTLRAIATAEEAYYATHVTYGTPADLVREKFLSPELAVGFGGTLDGYKYRQGKVDMHGFTFYAEPESPAQGNKSFAVNEDSVVRYTKGLTSAPGTGGTPLGDNTPMRPPPPPVDRRPPVPTPPPAPIPPPSAPAPPPPSVSTPEPRTSDDDAPKPERRGKPRKEKEPESAYPPPF